MLLFLQLHMYIDKSIFLMIHIIMSDQKRHELALI